MCFVHLVKNMANSDDASRMNLVTAPGNNEPISGDNVNVMPLVQGTILPGTAPDVGEVASGREHVGSTGRVASGPRPEFMIVAQALTVMMASMTELQERMVSMAGALGNAADVSGARGFLRDFANDAGLMHRCLARINVQEAPDAN